jgi:hypothetical protein
MHLLDVLGKRPFRINPHLESGNSRPSRRKRTAPTVDRRCIAGQEPVASESQVRKVTPESPYGVYCLGPALLGALP